MVARVNDASYLFVAKRPLTRFNFNPLACWNKNRSLNWHVHPPTAYCFGKHLLYLLPCSAVAVDDRHAILELARFLTELSVIDYFFVIHKPSVVSLAAILNAIEDIPGARPAISTFYSEVKKCTPVDPSHPDVAECRTRLRLLYAQGGYATNTSDRADIRNESVSPVCVSYGCLTSSPQCNDYHPKNY